MKVRRLLVLTALVSSILGAIVVYLFLSVPNDLKADALLKDARTHMTAGRNDQAHDALVRVIQQYPRTDAAAAATVALVKLEQQERENVQNELVKLQRDNTEQAKAIGDIQKSVAKLHALPAPKTETVAAPVKAPAKTTTAKKKPPAKKTTPKKKTTKKRKR